MGGGAESRQGRVVKVRTNQSRRSVRECTLKNFLFSRLFNRGRVDTSFLPTSLRRFTSVYCTLSITLRSSICVSPRSAHSLSLSFFSFLLIILYFSLQSFVILKTQSVCLSVYPPVYVCFDVMYVFVSQFVYMFHCFIPVFVSYLHMSFSFLS